MEAKSLVLMEKEEGILSKELGSFEIDGGIDSVLKAYVENNEVKLFLTTLKDVTDEEYTEVFEAYSFDSFEDEDLSIEEFDEEYNPVWLFVFPYNEEHTIVGARLNNIISKHLKVLSEM